MARYYNYVEIWNDDKRSIITIMERNLCADLEAGYDPLGNCIAMQREEITAYTHNYRKELAEIHRMTPEAAQRWCYRDLLRRGAID